MKVSFHWTPLQNVAVKVSLIGPQSFVEVQPSSRALAGVTDHSSALRAVASTLTIDMSTVRP